MSNYTVLGLNLKQWLYIICFCALCILCLGMITAYYQGLEKSIIENQNDVKWLKKENAELLKSVDSVTHEINSSQVVIGRLEKQSLELAKKSKTLMDSLNKLKLRYNEIGKRVDSLDVDGIRRYFSEL
jgi:predicted nuclease with TOPRIM domain